MKAVYFENFGSSEVLKIGDQPEPVMGPKDVLIRIANASINPADWKIREGLLQELLPHSLPIIPGWDVAGTIEKVGEEVEGFAPGEPVFAYARTDVVKYGTYAEKIALPATSVAKKPETISLAQAAAIPVAGLTAWQGLYEVLKIQAGETIFISAAAGGVGSFAVQLAKLVGATVIATASLRNHGYLKELGADYMIDYTTQDVPSAIHKVAPEGVDTVFAAAGGEALNDGFRVIREGGRLVSIADLPDQDLANEYQVTAEFLFVKPSAAQLEHLGKLIDKGHLLLPAIAFFSVKEAAKLQDINQQGHTRGKVVLEIDF